MPPKKKKRILEIIGRNCEFIAEYPLFEDFKYVHSYTKGAFSDPESIGLAIFTGGEDIDPDFYNQNKGSVTYCNPGRDDYEFKVYNFLRSYNIPLFGICRGAQFLCAMAGGKLCQHAWGHLSPFMMKRDFYRHNIKTHDERIVNVNSLHHQICIPPPDAQILAWAEPKLSALYFDGEDQPFQMDKEVEAAYYPKINAVGVQWHPEYLSTNHEATLLAIEYIGNYLTHKPNLIGLGENAAQK